MLLKKARLKLQQKANKKNRKVKRNLRLKYPQLRPSLKSRLLLLRHQFNNTNRRSVPELSPLKLNSILHLMPFLLRLRMTYAT